MKRSVILITGVIALISTCVSIFFAYQYYGENNIGKEKKQILILEEEIVKVKENIEQKNIEKEEVKNNNQEKVALLELWQKELAKLKK